MTAPERIWVGTWQGGQPAWAESHRAPEAPGVFEYIRADLHATIAAKCEALERGLAAKSRPLDPRMKAAIQEGYNAEAVALEKQVSEALAARVRSLEEENKRLEGLVFVAYQEGWVAAGGHWRSNSGWETSEVRAALTREETKT